MTDYTQLHYNVDTWYDSLNDVYGCLEPEELDVTYPQWNRYFYTYLSCIEEFSDDVE